jgi:hypothetical protein
VRAAAAPADAVTRKPIVPEERRVPTVARVTAQNFLDGKRRHRERYAPGQTHFDPTTTALATRPAWCRFRFPVWWVSLPFNYQPTNLLICECGHAAGACQLTTSCSSAARAWGAWMLVSRTGGYAGFNSKLTGFCLSCNDFGLSLRPWSLVIAGSRSLVVVKARTTGGTTSTGK